MIPCYLSRVLALYNVDSDLLDSWFSQFWEVSIPYESLPHLSSQHVLALNGHKNVMEYLYEKHHFDLKAQDSTRRTALGWAAERGHLAVSKWLIETGAEVNAQTGDYANPLHAASDSGHEEVVQVLLDRGAKVNTPADHHGNALWAASVGGHEKVVQMLLDRGAEVNAQGGRHDNALYTASEKGHEKVVQMLLDRGANIDDRETPYF